MPLCNRCDAEFPLAQEYDDNQQQNIYCSECVTACTCDECGGFWPEREKPLPRIESEARHLCVSCLAGYVHGFESWGEVEAVLSEVLE